MLGSEIFERVFINFAYFGMLVLSVKVISQALVWLGHSPLVCFGS